MTCDLGTATCDLQIRPAVRNSGKNVDEAYGIILFGLCGGSIEQSSSESHGFLYLDVFKRVMAAVNNVDVGKFGAGSLPGVQAHAQTPKSRRI